MSSKLQSWPDDDVSVMTSSSLITKTRVIEEILKLSPEKRRQQPAELSVKGSPSSLIMSPMRRMGMRSQRSSPRSSPYQRVIAMSPRKRGARCNLTNELCQQQSPMKKQQQSRDSPKKQPQSMKSPMKKQESMDSPKKLKSASKQIKKEQSTNDSPRNISRRILQHSTKCVSDTIGALHSSIPDQLLERNMEREVISTFIKENANNRTSKSLYISGSPGTGKTACVMTICQEMKDLLDDVIILNCMTITTSTAIYHKLAHHLGSTKKENIIKSKKFIEKQLSSKQGKMVLVILDEMDQLDGNEGDNLYQIFDWVSLQYSRLLLIGIANSLDLTDRVLPRLQVNMSLKPQLLNFKPYTQQELTQIIEARLPQEDKYGVIDRSAIQLCARKVAAKSGDARTSLDICRRAIEMKGGAAKVGISQICSLMAHTTTMDKKQEDNGDSLPMEQKLIICSLLTINKRQQQQANIGKLYEVYCDSCRQKSGALSQSDFISICNSLEDRRVFDIIKKNKQQQTNRQSKVKFAILESQVIESYFKGDPYFESILKQL